jgi:hypothetical protein
MRRRHRRGGWLAATRPARRGRAVAGQANRSKRTTSFSAFLAEPGADFGRAAASVG